MNDRQEEIVLAKLLKLKKIALSEKPEDKDSALDLLAAMLDASTEECDIKSWFVDLSEVKCLFRLLKQPSATKAGYKGPHSSEVSDALTEKSYCERLMCLLIRNATKEQLHRLIDIFVEREMPNVISRFMVPVFEFDAERNAIYREYLLNNLEVESLLLLVADFFHELGSDQSEQVVAALVKHPAACSGFLSLVEKHKKKLSKEQLTQFIGLLHAIKDQRKLFLAYIEFGFIPLTETLFPVIPLEDRVSLLLDGVQVRVFSQDPEAVKAAFLDFDRENRADLVCRAYLLGTHFEAVFGALRDKVSLFNPSAPANSVLRSLFVQIVRSFRPAEVRAIFRKLLETAWDIKGNVQSERSVCLVNQVFAEPAIVKHILDTGAFSQLVNWLVHADENTLLGMISHMLKDIIHKTEILYLLGAAIGLPVITDEADRNLRTPAERSRLVFEILKRCENSEDYKSLIIERGDRFIHRCCEGGLSASLALFIRFGCRPSAAHIECNEPRLNPANPFHVCALLGHTNELRILMPLLKRIPIFLLRLTFDMSNGLKKDTLLLLLAEAKNKNPGFFSEEEKDNLYKSINAWSGGSADERINRLEVLTEFVKLGIEPSFKDLEKTMLLFTELKRVVADSAVADNLESQFKSVLLENWPSLYVFFFLPKAETREEKVFIYEEVVLKQHTRTKGLQVMAISGLRKLAEELERPPEEVDAMVARMQEAERQLMNERFRAKPEPQFSAGGEAKATGSEKEVKSNSRSEASRGDVLLRESVKERKNKTESGKRGQAAAIEKLGSRSAAGSVEVQISSMSECVNTSCEEFFAASSRVEKAAKINSLIKVRRQIIEQKISPPLIVQVLISALKDKRIDNDLVEEAIGAFGMERLFSKTPYTQPGFFEANDYQYSTYTAQAYLSLCSIPTANQSVNQTIEAEKKRLVDSEPNSPLPPFLRTEVYEKAVKDYKTAQKCSFEVDEYRH